MIYFTSASDVSNLNISKSPSFQKEQEIAIIAHSILDIRYSLILYSATFMALEIQELIHV